MLFRVSVYILCTVRRDEQWYTGNVYWHDTVAYTFGVNAINAGNAAVMACQAAEHAFDRDGKYVGGIVLEVHPRCVNRSDFSGYNKYLLGPLDQEGIFYVTGICFTSILDGEIVDYLPRLVDLKTNIDRNGLPPASFKHPMPTVDETPKSIRMVCPICGHWTEVDHSGLLYSFFDGLDPISDEFDRAKVARETAGPFVKRHLECIRNSGSGAAIESIFDDDERFGFLDDEKRD
jgi:hypothetical protein